MTDSKIIIRTLMASVFSLMLIGCADDVEEQGELTHLQLIPYGSSFVGAELPTVASTRSIADGYTKYSSTLAGSPDIAIYLAAAAGSTCSYKGNFIHQSNDTWTSSVYAQTNTMYNVYGFMPLDIKNNASFAPIEGNYSKGAILTLSNMSAISSSDIAAIVGVLKGANDDGDISTNTTKSLNPGNYSYMTSAPGEDNCMYLLLDHIYSRISLCFAIDEEYNELRDIEVTDVKIEVLNAPETVNANVKLEAGKTSTMSLTTTFSTTTVNITTANLLTEGNITLSTTPQDVNQYCTPGLESLSFNVITTYNVKDKKGNYIREGCKATNSNIMITNTAAGKNYNINMTVTPTYLYQLSGPDLDNPTIIVN